MHTTAVAVEPTGESAAPPGQCQPLPELVARVKDAGNRSGANGAHGDGEEHARVVLRALSQRPR